MNLRHLSVALALLPSTLAAAPGDCDPLIVDLDGHDICLPSYPDNFVRFVDVHAGVAAGCGGTGTSVGLGYSSYPFVDFKSADTDVNVGDTVHVRYVGWASGSTGSIQIAASVSADGSTWFPCGTAPGRNFLGNHTVDTITCVSPVDATNLYVRLETTTLSPALVYVRSFELEVPEVCPSCQPDLGFGGPGGSVLSICGTGATGTLQVEGAPASTAGLLLASQQSNPTFVDFIGATLVPDPVTFLMPFATDGAGEWELPGVPLTSPLAPVSVYAQAVVIDPMQIGGVGVSNAVRLDLVP